MLIFTRCHPKIIIISGDVEQYGCTASTGDECESYPVTHDQYWVLSSVYIRWRQCLFWPTCHQSNNAWSNSDSSAGTCAIPTISMERMSSEAQKKKKKLAQNTRSHLWEKGDVLYFSVTSQVNNLVSRRVTRSLPLWGEQQNDDARSEFLPEIWKLFFFPGIPDA